MGKRKIEKAIVPAYMTSFADMMTIVLTFFILLYSFAEDRQLGIIQQRARAFEDAIKSMGLPGLMETSSMPVTLEKMKPKFPIFPGYDQDSKEQDPRDMESHLPYLKGVEIEKFRRQMSVKIPIVPAFKRKVADVSMAQQQFLLPLLPLLENKAGVINITGYAEQEFSSSAANLELALKRAINILYFLKRRGNISLARMRPIAQTASLKNYGRQVVLSFENF